MPPPAATQTLLLSPAELSYLHDSLSQTPPIRPDARSPTQFRPLVAETNILPGTNGSARICFADGTEAIVGVKAEVEKSVRSSLHLAVEEEIARGMEGSPDDSDEEEEDETGHGEDGDESKGERGKRRGDNAWVDIAVEIPGMRDDDALPVFLGQLLEEALLADGEFADRLWINRRFHWKIYVDILLLSPPLSYPLPLLSLTTHLALLSTRLPRLKSEKDEDPLFDDDWEAAPYLYPRTSGKGKAKGTAKQQQPTTSSRPPVTLLVMAVGDNIIFDPSKEELAVADVLLAVSVGETASSPSPQQDDNAMDVDTGLGSKSKSKRKLRLLSVRTIDPPSRLTPSGVPNFMNSATGGTAPTSTEESVAQLEGKELSGVWLPPRGGAKRKMISAMVGKVLEEGGVAEEVMDGLVGVDLG